MPQPTHAKLAAIEKYLVAHGFSGDIALNNGRKNAVVIKRLMRRQPFYTFGITALEHAIRHRQLSSGQVRTILIEASGVDAHRFRRRGPGYLDPAKSAAALAAALAQIAAASRARQQIVFATGHPGAMVGFMIELADWSKRLGGRLVTITGAIPTHGQMGLDIIGPVLVPSDGCSAYHSHETIYIDRLLELAHPDLVVADHGFAGGALNHGLATIGFYDTDDPALPVASRLGLPLLAVPLNDNRFNADGAALARFLVKELG